MSARDAAIAEIVEIALRHDLTRNEISDALESTLKESPGGTLLSRLFAYIGGIFIFSGLAVLITMFWEDMNTAAHLVVTLGAGIVALILAIQLLSSDRFAKAATPLFLIAAVLQSTGIMVAFDELGTGGDVQHALLAMTTVMTLQMMLVFWRHRRDVLLFVALVFGVLSLGNALELMDIDDELITLLAGLSLMILTYGLDRTAHRSITPFWYFAGSAMLLWAAFDLIRETPFHVFYLGLAAFVIYLSTISRSRTLLFTGTLSMMAYLGYFTAEYFVDSIGWPLVLIVLGLLFIGVSSAAIRINNKFISRAQE